MQELLYENHFSHCPEGFYIIAQAEAPRRGERSLGNCQPTHPVPEGRHKPIALTDDLALQQLPLMDMDDNGQYSTSIMVHYGPLLSIIVHVNKQINTDITISLTKKLILIVDCCKMEVINFIS